MYGDPNRAMILGVWRRRYHVRPFLLFLMGVIVSASAAPRPATADEPAGRAPAQWLEVFAKGWDETAWHTPFRTAPSGYMRKLDDGDWRVRMEAFQGVVRRGKEAVPVMLEALKAEAAPQRIFAAQALGFLAPDVPTEPLIEAAKGDPDAAVRLHAWDAAGMNGAQGLDFEALLAAEPSGDVKKHIAYVRERAGKRLDPAVVMGLKEWDAKTAASAAVGLAAPEFELKAATGEIVRLADFKGKSAVVLVFIYGDT